MKGPMQVDQPQNIEYTQYMPGSRHYNDRGKDLGADRVGTKLVIVTLAMQDPAAARAFYLDKLKFTPNAHNPMLLNLPGDIGEMVKIVPVAQLGAKSDIVSTSPESADPGSVKAKGVDFTDGNTLTGYRSRWEHHPYHARAGNPVEKDAVIGKSNPRIIHSSS